MDTPLLSILNLSFLGLFVAIITTIVTAPFFIGILYKTGQVSGIKKTKLKGIDGTNALFMKIMNTNITNGTPNMGGIIILTLVPILLTIFVPGKLTNIFILGFVLQGLFGLVDQIFTNAIKNNGRLKALQETFEWRLGKLIFVVFLNTIILYVAHKVGVLADTLTVGSMITVSIGSIASILVLGLVQQFAVYSADLIDGLDGLMIGTFILVTLGFITLLIIQRQYTFIPYLMIILGVLIVDLYFNVHPARFWNGGPGAMPLGFTMFFIALQTDNLLPYFIMTSATWLDMASSAIQILSMKLRKKRVFKIAPFHHHLQAIGWEHTKVVMRIWIFVGVTVLVGIWVGINL